MDKSARFTRFADKVAQFAENPSAPGSFFEQEMYPLCKKAIDRGIRKACRLHNMSVADDDLKDVARESMCKVLLGVTTWRGEDEDGLSNWASAIGYNTAVNWAKDRDNNKNLHIPIEDLIYLSDRAPNPEKSFSAKSKTSEINRLIRTEAPRRLQNPLFDLVNGKVSSVSAAAKKYDLCPELLFKWIRHPERIGKLVALLSADPNTYKAIVLLHKGTFKDVYGSE